MYQMRYFKACLLESLRCTPTIGGQFRVLANDVILSGYHIPAGTMVAWNWDLLGKDNRMYDDPHEFKPERWSKDTSNIHPFTSVPFGYGPRKCVGQRFAELEMQLCIAHLLRNFNIEWAGEGDIETEFKMTNLPNKELKFRFIEI